MNEDDLADRRRVSRTCATVREYVATHLACEAVVVSAQHRERPRPTCRPRPRRRSSSPTSAWRNRGIGELIRATYHLLGLRTYFTAGEKEVRAWTIHAGDTAPQAAGVIHSDFERGFIKAETVSYDDLVAAGSMAAAREKGLFAWKARSTSSRTAT